MSAVSAKGDTVLSAGQHLKSAEGVVVLLHGRGSTAAAILSLAKSLAGPSSRMLRHRRLTSLGTRIRF